MISLRWTMTFGFLLVVAVGCGPVFQPIPEGEPAVAPLLAPESVESVPGYAKVSDSLCRGDQPDAEGFAELANKGVKTVICLRILDRDSELLTGLGFRYRHISFKHWHPEQEDLLEFLAIVANPENQPVFVHCRQGVDRTGMMVAAYRVVVQDWTKDKAIAEMREMGFHDEQIFIERFLEDIDPVATRLELSKHPPPKLGIIP